MNTRRSTTRRMVSLAASVWLVACSQHAPESFGELALVEVGAPALLQGRHIGPPVIAGPSGPKRFVDVLYGAFDVERAMQTVVFVDRYYRAPANEGYEAVLEHLAERLRQAGFGSTPGFELEFIETPLLDTPAAGGARAPARAWTPISGRISIAAPGAAARTLHSFAGNEGRDRTLLPVHAPECDVEGPIALDLSELDEGEVLVTAAPPNRDLINRAKNRGAVALISANIEPYNVDPTGKFRHLDAVQYRRLGFGATLPVGMISQRSHSAIKAAVDEDNATRLHFEARVRYDDRPLRTLCATIRGSDRPDEAVATVSHVQEPGACDNASGVAGLLESAVGLARAIANSDLPRPSRSLVFLWGDEFRQSTAWLDATKLKAVAGLSSDMTGESQEKTGAIALLERMPDPGGVEPFEPDAHTPWGKSEVDAAKLTPNGLAVVARCALLDVAELAGGWDTADHPYEGGSDHDEFIKRGVPAALFWHFTDYAYHTSLDRLENVDGDEIKRTGVALMATALALADPLPADLDRYLRSLNEERKVRVAAAEAGQRADIAELWRQWTDGAREWLRIECLRIPASETK